MPQKQLRLRKSRDFLLVARNGRAFNSRSIVLRIKPNEMGIIRFGFVVSRIIGGAVTRNKVKRRLKHIVQEVQIKNNWDIVISARKNAKVVDFAKLKKETRELLAKAEVLENVISIK
jgi:ribonuclease P protein component